ncbi:MAG: RMD1 family protein [Pseudomonadota bacterium]
MRCVSYVAARNYPIALLATKLKQEGYKVNLYRNKVLYIFSKSLSVEAYCFDHGCLVCWGMLRRREQELLAFINSFATQLLDKIEKNFHVFRYAKQTEITIGPHFDMELISLEAKDDDIKFAISYGLAQSAKLEFYEDMTQALIKKFEEIPRQLAEKGKIIASKQMISQAMGEIFSHKSSINLSSEYLDIPEYFWEHSSGASYYLMTEKYFDIKQRVSALNQKLNVLQDLFDILSNQLQYRHSTFLESVIVYLILIEIVLMVIFYFVQH